MNAKILHTIGVVIAVILAVLGSILAYADRVSAIAAVNPVLAHYWPFVVLVISALVPILQMIATKIKDIVPILVAFLIVSFFSGCAGYQVGVQGSYTNTDGETYAGGATIYRPEDSKQIKPISR